MPKNPHIFAVSKGKNKLTEQTKRFFNTTNPNDNEIRKYKETTYAHRSYWRSQKQMSSERSTAIMTMKVFATVIATALFTLNANAESKKNVKNTQSTPEMVEISNTNSRSMVQSVSDGSSYKFDYILDNEGRVVNKITSAWDELNSQWAPLSAYSVVYTKDETILSYAKYNKDTKTYTKDVQQTRYNASDYPVIINLPECCK